MADFQKSTINRRTILKTGVAVGALQIAAPYIVKAQGEQAIKIGVDNPLTGIYTALGKNENTGMELAAEQANAKGGILGRKIELVVEDFDLGQNRRRRAEGAQAHPERQGRFPHRQRELLASDRDLAGRRGAQDAAYRSWRPCRRGDRDRAASGRPFRVCNTGAMQGNAMAKPLVNIGKKIYIIAQDYAFGHSLADGLTKGATAAGGTIIGTDFFPLGTTDYSATLIKARGANPDVLVDLAAGDDGINSLKQAVQFGIDKQVHLAGMQQELEVLEGLPPEARTGTWLFEWYYNQPNVPHVADFVAAIRKKTNKVPTARTWFGYAALWSFVLAANNAKSIEAVKVCHALEGLKLPPEVACQPGEPFYRAEDHQLVPAVFVGHAQAKGTSDPEDLFVVDQVVQGPSFMPPASQTGCKLNYPT